MSYTDVLDLVAADAEAKVRAIWEQWTAGALTQQETVLALAGVVGNANATAAALADTAVAATATRLLGALQQPAGITPGDESERLMKAAQTLTERAADTPSPADRVGRFGRCEPLDTAQRVYGEAMRANGHVVGWQRALSPGACELCQWLEKDGHVYPPERPMHHHTGCRCQQVMVMDTEATE